MNDETAWSPKQLIFPFTIQKAAHYIFFIGLFVYANSLSNGFVWDDFSNIVYNSQTHILSLQSLFQQGIINTGLQYRPLVSLYFSLLYALFGDTAFFYHLCNVFFHITNSIVVLVLFTRFFKTPLSFFLSLIFLVHPMQVESATFIATAGNVYFLFGLIAFLLATTNPLTNKYISIISFLLFLSLLAKETGILFLFMIVVSLWMKKKLVIQKVFLLSLLTIFPYIFLRFIVGNNSITTHSLIIPIAQLSTSDRFVTIPAVFLYYLQTFFYPKDLIIMQHWVIQERDFLHLYMPLSIVVLFLALCSIYILFLYKTQQKKAQHFLFFSLWFLSGMLLHIQVFPLNMTVADRWFYFPMIGMLGMIGICLGQITIKKTRLYIFGVTTCAILILLLLSVRTIIRNFDWHDDLTLYNHDKALLDNFIIENNLGWNYQHIHDFKHALPYYKKSVDLFPGWAISLNNLGYTYEVLQEKEKARGYFYKVLQANDYHQEEYTSDLAFSAWALTQFDNPHIAKDFIQKALKKAPNNPYLWAHLAHCEYDLHNQEQAEQAIAKARSMSANPLILYLSQRITNHQSIPTNFALIN